MASQGGQDFTAGLVTRIDFLRPNEDPNKLIVIVGVTHGCGSLDRAYTYEYDQRKPKWVMESRSRREHDEQILAIRLSQWEPHNNQLALFVRYAMQCGSSWNGLAYDLHRFSRTKPIWSDEHGIWLGGDDPEFRLSPNRVELELTDRSIDTTIHNRRHVLHYSINGDTR